MLSTGCSHRIRDFGLMAAVFVLFACNGQIELQPARKAYPLMAGCLPEEIKCSRDMDGAWVCGCGDLWTCNANRTRCERPRLTPDDQQDWDCTWEPGQYLCHKDNDMLFSGSGGWNCSQSDQSGNFAWDCLRPPPTPNRKIGDKGWTCEVHNLDSLLICKRTVEIYELPKACANAIDKDGDGDIDYDDPDCMPPFEPYKTEVDCSNGMDDDNDGLIDCADYEDCRDECEFSRCSWQTQDCEGAVDDCKGNELCYRAWVDQRCNGTVLMNTHGEIKTFTCRDQETCTDFRCTALPTVCEWSELDCGTSSGCDAGDAPCFFSWVQDRCSAPITTTLDQGNFIYSCTDDKACVNVRCQATPQECPSWTPEDCKGQTACIPGDEACHYQWVVDKCMGLVTTTKPGKNRVFDCVDEQACKTYHCETTPPIVCDWNTDDCEKDPNFLSKPGDEVHYENWVKNKPNCAGNKTMVTTNASGDKIFTCLDDKACTKYRCQAKPCVWTHFGCPEDATKCPDGDEACYRKGVDDACLSTITETINPGGNKVFYCEDAGPICKTYTCETKPKECTWTAQDCQGLNDCVPGDEGCYRNWVDNRCGGNITESTNASGNKVFSCIDEDPICKTYTCESLPKPVEPCVWNTYACSMGHCNLHMGDNEQECYRAGNSGGCNPEELRAWCTRRVPGLDGTYGLWFTYHKKWVEDRCGGPAELLDTGARVPNLYRCVNNDKCEIYTCETPLVLVFDETSAVAYQADDGQSAFDLSAAQDGGGMRTDWPTATTPWLALDRDGDGCINSGQELFGSATLLEDQSTARHGFAALAALDQNGDGKINAQDPGFSKLQLWSDQDGDRVSSKGELQGLGQRGIVSLSLSYTVQPRCDARGNCERERATFLWRDKQGQLRRGAIVDIYLRNRQPVRAVERGAAHARDATTSPREAATPPEGSSPSGNQAKAEM